MQDLLEELGALALGSRLKRLSDALMQEGTRVYQATGVGFEPRWFPVFIYLYRRGPTAITALARGLGVSHPAINKVAGELIAARLVAPYRDRSDKRKRVLALTSTGRAKAEELEPVWQQIRQSLQSLVDEDGGEFLQALSRVERSYCRKGFLDRFVEVGEQEGVDVQIIPFEASLAGAFRELNEKWIQHYFAIESADRRVLEDPQGAVIDPGGEILFARDTTKGEILGTVALLKLDDQVAELAKMAVLEKAKGRRLGLRLGEAVIDLAREQGFRKLVLESNRRLTPAISLYRKLGFVEKPFPHGSDYSRADIYMEQTLV